MFRSASVYSAVAVLLAASVAWGQGTPPHKPTYANVAYGTHARQVLDFYQAKTAAPAPVMYFIHGGGWMSGDKNTPDFLDACLKTGISVVSVEYRLIPDANQQKIEPPVKACLEDVARALQFVRSKAGEWKIDKQRIVCCGGSAGGYSCLWLAFHSDMADAAASDPVARESTRVAGVLAFVPQTSLDPRQLKDWIPNINYGGHAFNQPSFETFLDKRESLMPWIQANSPYAMATAKAPPICLFYDSVPSVGQPYRDPPHSANFGTPLAEKLQKLGVECDFNYPGAKGLKYPDLFQFLRSKLNVRGSE